MTIGGNGMLFNQGSSKRYYTKAHSFLNGTPKKHAIYDVIRIEECAVREAVKGEVGLPDAFLHEADEIAKSILVIFAALDASHWQNSIVENEPHVGGISRCWAGQNLSD